LNQFQKFDVGFVRAKRKAKKKVVKKLIKKKKKKKKNGKNGTIFSRLFSFFLPLQCFAVLDFDAGLPDRMLEVQKWPKIAKKCQKMPI
jgi:hypothetical protein